MNDILALQQINLAQWFVDLLVIMIAVSAIVGIIGRFSDLIGKPFKWVKKKNEDHDLLINLSKRVSELTDKHITDMEISDRNDAEIKKCLDDFVRTSSERNEQVRKDLAISINKIEENITKLYDDNLAYRDVSRDIRDGMNQKIQAIIERNERKDELVDAIANGNKELLGDKIDQKFEKYVRLKGIPENEVDEFESLCQAYFRLKGNHNRKSRYEYVKNNMPILPVETSLAIKE